MLKKDSVNRDELRRGLAGADDDDVAPPVQGLRDLKNRRGLASASVDDDTIAKMKGEGQADILKAADELKKQLQEQRDARIAGLAPSFDAYLGREILPSSSELLRAWSSSEELSQAFARATLRSSGESPERSEVEEEELLQAQFFKRTLFSDCT